MLFLFYHLAFVVFSLIVSAFLFHLAWLLGTKTVRKRWLVAIVAVIGYFAGAFIISWLTSLSPTLHQNLLENMIFVQDRFSITSVHIALLQVAVCFAMATWYWRSTNDSRNSTRT